MTKERIDLINEFAQLTLENKRLKEELAYVEKLAKELKQIIEKTIKE